MTRPAGTYICDEGSPGCPCAADYVTGSHVPLAERHCWHNSTRRRLEWQYGENRVDASDVAAWNRVGMPERAAA